MTRTPRALKPPGLKPQRPQASPPTAMDRTTTSSLALSPRRFVAKAKDKDSHCGYQDWHRQVDAEVIQWLREHDKATPAQFMQRLREIYNRKEMRERFPHGF